MNLAIIGHGNISEFHIPAMKKAGFNIVAVAGGPNSNSLQPFAKKHEINKLYKSSKDLISDSKVWDALLILSPVSTVIDYLHQAAPYGKPILTEKPVAYNHLHLEGLIKYKNIRVAYNRRFYAGVSFLKKFILDYPATLVKISLPEARKDPDHNIDFPHRLPLMSYENSVHIFDLMNFIFKDITWKETSFIKAKDKYLGIVALGASKNDVTIQLDSYFNAADNFSIQVFSDEYRVEMRPIEVTSIYKGMSISEASKEVPISLYSPSLHNKIIEFSEDGFKPGFLEQAKDFMNFCLGKDDCVGADMMDAYSALKLAHSLVE